MTPEVIDAVTLAGDRAKPNDDAFGAAGDRVWVIDGATSLGSNLLPGGSDAAWLARTANRLFATHHGIRDTRQLLEVVANLLAGAFQSEAAREPKARWELPVASFLMLTAREGEVEAVWLGDCRGLVEADGAIHAVGETPAGEAKERAYAARLGGALGAAAMLRAAPVIEDLRRQRDTCNSGKPDRWLLGLEPKAAAHLNRTVIAAPGGFAALLMTDGFSALELKYARHDAAGMLAAARDQGLAALAAALRRIEEVEDPDGAAYPRFKRSDDATAVLARFS